MYLSAFRIGGVFDASVLCQTNELGEGVFQPHINVNINLTLMKLYISHYFGSTSSYAIVMTKNGHDGQGPNTSRIIRREVLQIAGYECRGGCAIAITKNKFGTATCYSPYQMLAVRDVYKT